MTSTYDRARDLPPILGQRYLSKINLSPPAYADDILMLKQEHFRCDLFLWLLYRARKALLWGQSSNAIDAAISGEEHLKRKLVLKERVVKLKAANPNASRIAL